MVGSQLKATKSGFFHFAFFRRSSDARNDEIEQIRLLLYKLFDWDHVGQCGRQLTHFGSEQYVWQTYHVIICVYLARRKLFWTSLMVEPSQKVIDT